MGRSSKQTAAVRTRKQKMWIARSKLVIPKRPQTISWWTDPELQKSYQAFGERVAENQARYLAERRAQEDKENTMSQWRES